MLSSGGAVPCYKRQINSDVSEHVQGYRALSSL